MPSPERCLLAMTAGLVLLAVGAAWLRSTIPIPWDGPVERVEMRREKHPGLDDVYLVTVSGRTWHVDASVATRLEPGMHVRKRPLSTTLQAGEESITLRASRDAYGLVGVGAILLLLVGVLLCRPGAPRSADAGEDGPWTSRP